MRFPRTPYFLSGLVGKRDFLRDRRNPEETGLTDQRRNSFQQLSEKSFKIIQCHTQIFATFSLLQETIGILCAAILSYLYRSRD